MVDFDKNGTLEYSEFIVAALSEDEIFTDVKIQCAFNIFDRNRSGTITIDEIKENMGLKNHPDEAIINEIFQQANMDHDNEISYDEFSKFMKNLTD